MKSGSRRTISTEKIESASIPDQLLLSRATCEPTQDHFEMRESGQAKWANKGQACVSGTLRQLLALVASRLVN